MAALYLHNAIFSPETSDSSSTTSRPSHSRHLSVVSTGTLRTSASEHSYPTEPLLYSGPSESPAYRDLLSRQPNHPDVPQLGWDAGLNLEGDLITIGERKEYREQSVRRKLKRLRFARCGLEIVMGEYQINYLYGFRY